MLPYRIIGYNLLNWLRVHAKNKAKQKSFKKIASPLVTLVFVPTHKVSPNKSFCFSDVHDTLSPAQTATEKAGSCIRH